MTQSIVDKIIIAALFQAFKSLIAVAHNLDSKIVQSCIPENI